MVGRKRNGETRRDEMRWVEDVMVKNSSCIMLYVVCGVVWCAGGDIKSVL